jgi:DNA polymerase-3 subunit delta'
VPFRDFVGNKSVVETLERQLRKGRLPHALLFAGPAGVGKKTLAIGLAKALNCLTDDFDFCDGCESCRKINEAAHPDVRLYSPEGQFIKIDQMRGLSREAFFRPFEGRQRVFIIEQADRLKTEAANSILKTVEEPPDTSTIILISEKPNDLLLTIRSRAHLYALVPLGRNALDQYLAQETDYSSEDRALLARISGGTIGKALSIDIDEYKRTRQEMLDLLRNCASDFAYNKVARTIDGMASRKEVEREKSEFRLSVLYDLLHDLYRLKIDEAFEDATNSDLKGDLLSLGSSFSLAQLISAAEVLDRIELGARRNLNKGLLLDAFVFRLSGTSLAEQVSPCEP